MRGLFRGPFSLRPQDGEEFVGLDKPLLGVGRKLSFFPNYPYLFGLGQNHQTSKTLINNYHGRLYIKYFDPGEWAFRNGGAGCGVEPAQ